MHEIESKIMKKVNNNGFMVPNDVELYQYDPRELFSTIYSMINRGILRRRDCEGLAFELNT
jgi:hypothetical protein